MVFSEIWREPKCGWIVTGKCYNSEFRICIVEKEEKSFDLDVDGDIASQELQRIVDIVHSWFLKKYQDAILHYSKTALYCLPHLTQAKTKGDFLTSYELKEQVGLALKKYSTEYSRIDENIEPLCNLLGEMGYLTLHSCEGHINVTRSPGSKHFVPHNVWYVVFTTTNALGGLCPIVEELRNYLGTPVTLCKMVPSQGLNERFYIGQSFPKSFTVKDIKTAHHNIYKIFEKYKKP